MRGSAIPVSLFVGLVIGFYAAAVTAVSWLVPGLAFEPSTRWTSLAQGLEVAAGVLVVHAVFGLARRPLGVNRIAMLIAGWSYLAVVAWWIARPLLEILETGEHSAWWMRSAHAMGVLALAGAISLAIATRAWRTAPIAAAGCVLLALTSAWMPVTGEWFWGLFGSPRTQSLVWILRDLAFAACTLWMVVKLPRIVASPEPQRAAIALRRAAALFVAELVVGFAIGLIWIGSVDGGSDTLALSGAVMVVVMLASAWQLLDIEAAGIGMPRLRLVLGAAATAWWAGVQTSHVGMTYQWSAELEQFLEPKWTIIGPVVGVVGLVLVGSAISRFALDRGDLELQRHAASRTVTFAMLSFITLVLDLLRDVAPTGGGMLAMVLAGTGVYIASMIVMAGLLARAARAVESQPGLPVATVRA